MYIAAAAAAACHYFQLNFVLFLGREKKRRAGKIKQKNSWFSGNIQCCSSSQGYTGQALLKYEILSTHSSVLVIFRTHCAAFESFSRFSSVKTRQKISSHFTLSLRRKNYFFNHTTDYMPLCLFTINGNTKPIIRKVSHINKNQIIKYLWTWFLFVQTHPELK